MDVCFPTRRHAGIDLGTKKNGDAKEGIKGAWLWLKEVEWCARAPPKGWLADAEKLLGSWLTLTWRSAGQNGACLGLLGRISCSW